MVNDNKIQSKQTTKEVFVSKTKEEIIKEAKRIEESTRITAKSHYDSSMIWGGCHYLLGIPTTVLSTIVAVNSFARFDPEHNIAGFIAIIVAALSALITFLNPHQKASSHHKAGNDYDALNNKARIFRTIDCWGKDSDLMLTTKIKGFSEAQSKLNSSYPQPLPFAYFTANRGIRKGQADFEVDQ